MNTAASGVRTNYLNTDYSVRSWLFTTDHKRIAILYLVSISAFFAIGGALAGMLRLALLTPHGDLVQAETYNKLFTMHGITMIFFFLIPSIPAVLGNFLVPIMVGARDLAFPRINLLSWYVYVLGGTFTLVAAVTGGVDTGWTFYTPYSSTYSNTHVIATAVGVFLGGGGVPALVGYLAEVASFSTAFTVVGALAILSPLLLRVGTREAGAGDAASGGRT